MDYCRYCGRPHDNDELECSDCAANVAYLSIDTLEERKHWYSVLEDGRLKVRPVREVEGGWRL
jgi:hypothetical protein